MPPPESASSTILQNNELRCLKRSFLPAFGRYKRPEISTATRATLGADYGHLIINTFTKFKDDIVDI